MTEEIKKILEELVNKSAGCVCLDWAEGKCHCSQAILQAISEIDQIYKLAMLKKLEGVEEIIQLHSISQIFIERHTVEETGEVFEEIKSLSQAIKDHFMKE